MDDGNGNRNECKGVKMKSRSKLGNDRKVKFVGPKKSVRLREKACGPLDIWKLPKNYHSLPFPIPSSLFIDMQTDPLFWL